MSPLPTSFWDDGPAFTSQVIVTIKVRGFTTNNMWAQHVVRGELRTYTDSGRRYLITLEATPYQGWCVTKISDRGLDQQKLVSFNSHIIWGAQRYEVTYMILESPNSREQLSVEEHVALAPFWSEVGQVEEDFNGSLHIVRGI